ncbi:MAG: TIM-barrel domain-containing protein [bacterium]
MKKVKWYAIAAFLIALSAMSVSEAATPSKNYTKTKDGLILNLPGGVLKTQAVTDGIFRVLYTPTGSVVKTKSLVVLPKKRPTPEWRLTADADYAILTTKKVIAKVSLKTGAIVFSDLKGNIILREREDGGRDMPPVLVSKEKTYNAKQTFELTPTEGLYGLGQYQDGVMNWRNHDVAMAQVNTIVIVPFLVSTNGYGIYWDNYSLCKFHDGADGMSLWADVADAIDYYFVYGPDMDSAIKGYRDLTGAAPMFGKWAYGYWQSKERYKTDQELVDIGKEYRDRKLPIDNIVQDWMYWGKYGWGAMKFDEEFYPNPKKAFDELHKMNFHVMISIWPKFEPGSEIFKEMGKKGHIVTSPEGKYSPYYDAHSEEARNIFWKYASKGLFSKGIDSWWMDATEPEITGGRNPEEHAAAIKSMNNISLGINARYVNTFPLMTTKGVYENQRREAPNKRVFILTRSAFAGQQRNAAVTWSGDIEGQWDVLRKQISGGLNFSMAGIPYWTTDIGAFFVRYADGCKNDEYRELYVRWFQFGAFCPIFRSHGTHTPREIWQFGSKGDWAYDSLEKFDNLRYRMLPYIYSVAWEITNDGYTMMRGLPFDFKNDRNVYGIDDQFMFGPSFLVNPVTVPMYNKEKVNAIAQLIKDTKSEVKVKILHDWKVKSRKVYLPVSAGWYDFWTGEKLAGGQTIDSMSPISIMPLYVRAGSIVPLGPKLQYATEKPSDPIELRIYPGADSKFVIYEDENDNYNYEKGSYAVIPISWNETAKSVTIGERKGAFPGMLKSRSFNIVVVGSEHGVGLEPEAKPDRSVKYSGKSVSVKF